MACSLPLTLLPCAVAMLCWVPVDPAVGRQGVAQGSEQASGRRQWRSGGGAGGTGVAHTQNCACGRTVGLVLSQKCDTKEGSGGRRASKRTSQSPCGPAGFARRALQFQHCCNLFLQDQNVANACKRPLQPAFLGRAHAGARTAGMLRSSLQHCDESIAKASVQRGARH